MRTPRRFIRYGVVGASNTLVGLSAYFIVLYVVKSMILALVVAQVVGMSNSLIWNKYWTFESRDFSLGEIGRFVVVYGVSFVADLLLLRVLVYRMHWNEYWAQVVAVLAITLGSYLGHRSWTFARR